MTAVKTIAKGILYTVGVLFALGIVVVGCVLVAVPDDEVAGTGAFAAAEDDPDPTSGGQDNDPTPRGRITGECDLLLFVHGAPGDVAKHSELAATVDVENTGDVGAVVRVVASFDQLGRRDLNLRERVRVEPGETRQVNLSKRIGSDLVARHQDGGYTCSVDGEVLGAFGDL